MMILFTGRCAALVQHTWMKHSHFKTQILNTAFYSIGLKYTLSFFISNLSPVSKIVIVRMLTFFMSTGFQIYSKMEGKKLVALARGNQVHGALQRNIGLVASGKMNAIFILSAPTTFRMLGLSGKCVVSKCIEMCALCKIVEYVLCHF